MDEALILTAVDLSGRSFLGFDLLIPTQKVGDFDTELVEEFWLGFVRKAECTLHIKEFSGSNSHHIIEGAFKSAARSLKKAGPELPRSHIRRCGRNRRLRHENQSGDTEGHRSMHLTDKRMDIHPEP